MTSPFDVLQRGYDSSGRPLLATRMGWQHFDRVNASVGGLLVIVQGAFVTGTSASAGTHDRAGCMDIRTWNLTADQRYTAIKQGRELSAAAWYRHWGQGFDPHIHWVLDGDEPMASLAVSQIDMWHKGFNGLGWYSARDDFPWRPSTFRPYQYIKDEDQMNENQEALLRQVAADAAAIREGLKKFRDNEHARDVDEAKRDKARHQRLVKRLAEHADRLTVLINSTKDDATRRDLREMQARTLRELREDDAVVGVDNPSEDGIAESERESGK